MNTADFGQWYYLIYLVPGVAALAMLTLPALGGSHHHGAHGHGLTGHHGHGTSTAHGVGHNASAGHITHHPHAAHTPLVPTGGNSHRSPVTARTGQELGGRESVSARTPGAALLGFFGIGSVPPPIVLGGLLLGWSVTGLWTTAGLQQAVHAPALFVLPALGAATLGALVTSKLITAAFARMMPVEENLAVSTMELIGLTGTVAYPIDETRGRVHIYDDHGTLHDCPARIEIGKSNAGEAIGRDKSILVVDYDREHDQLIVEEIA